MQKRLEQFHQKAKNMMKKQQRTSYQRDFNSISKSLNLTEPNLQQIHDENEQEAKDIDLIADELLLFYVNK